MENNKSMDCNNFVENENAIKNLQKSKLNVNGNSADECEGEKDNLKSKVVEKMVFIKFF